MAEYAYRGIDAQGKKVSGFYEATGLEDLEYRLEKQGFHLVSAQLRKQSSSLFASRKIQRRQMIVFYMYLEQMADAGIPILDALVEMRNGEESDAMRKMISSLIDEISAGQVLSGAMLEYPEVFTDLMVNLVKAGEQTGNMSDIFSELKETLIWQDDIARKTKKLMSYPIFVGSIVFCVICFLMIYLVPQLISFIVSMNQEIPLLTRALIVVSDIFVNYWYLIISLPPVIIISIKVTLKKNDRAKYLFDQYKLDIPLFGEAIKKLILSRFSKSFALLYDAGVNVLDCLSISSDTVSNVYLESELYIIREKISNGSGITEAFAEAQLFPPLVLRMMNVGEQTGELGKSLIKISDFYTNDVSDLIEKIQLMIEPAMTVVMGVLLGWIMLAVLGPIYDIISSIQF